MSYYFKEIYIFMDSKIKLSLSNGIFFYNLGKFGTPIEVVNFIEKYLVNK
jgi:hypothetical protein